MLQKKLDAEIDYVSLIDSAVDNDKLEEQRKAHDEKHSAEENPPEWKPEPPWPLKDGVEPTVFVLRPLSRDAMRAVERLFARGDRVQTIDAFHLAVEYGTKDIRNFLDDSGAEVKAKHCKGEYGQALTQDCLKSIYDSALFVELGSRIYEMSKVHPLS